MDVDSGRASGAYGLFISAVWVCPPTIDIEHRWRHVHPNRGAGVFDGAKHSHAVERCHHRQHAGLFTYRQVFPIDTVLVRAALEGMLLLISALFLLTGLGLFGSGIVPHDVLSVMVALSALWLSGLGLGLMMSVANELIPEVGKVTGMLFRPLYFLSGIMYPVSAIPPPYRDWLLLNPFVHGIETLRNGFFPQYHVVDGVSLSYLLGFALVTVCLGLALHVRFGGRLVAQ